MPAAVQFLASLSWSQGTHSTTVRDPQGPHPAPAPMHRQHPCFVCETFAGGQALWLLDTITARKTGGGHHQQVMEQLAHSERKPSHERVCCIRTGRTIHRNRRDIRL